MKDTSRNDFRWLYEYICYHLCQKEWVVVIDEDHHIIPFLRQDPWNVSPGFYLILAPTAIRLGFGILRTFPHRHPAGLGVQVSENIVRIGLALDL